MATNKETPFSERDLQQIIPVIMKELYYTDGGGVSEHYPTLVGQVQSILRDLAEVRHKHNDKVFVAVLKAFSRFEHETHTATMASPNGGQARGIKRKESELGPARFARRQRRSELHQHMMQMKDGHMQKVFGTADPEI